MTPTPPPDRISVCLATYRRLDRLDLLLHDLAEQQRLPDEVVVVDNDPEASARSVIERHRGAGSPFALIYDVQPRKNISLTRNRTVELASGNWLAFIDDDERAPAAWLEQLLIAVKRNSADGVLGPVLPVLPESGVAGWIRRGRFYDWPRLPTGHQVPVNQLRFGNLLLSASRLKAENPVFDPAYGVTGGEDGDLLMRMVAHGSRLIWCDEAQVTEPVEASRLRLGWILRRALRGGQDFARHFQAGRLGGVGVVARLLFFGRALLQLVLALLLALSCLPLGLHRSVHWLARACANFGKLSVLWGWHYREYA